jgi:hypothetical protein
MKKTSRSLAVLAALIAFLPAAARAEKPVLTKLGFTSVVCNIVEDTANEDGLSKIGCKPEDIKAYPVLKDLTKDRTVKGTAFQFDFTRIEDKALSKPLLLVNMRNEMIYTIWGSIGIFEINEDGSFAPKWTIGGGTATHTASCPGKLTFIVPGNERPDLSQWVYTGTEVKRASSFPSLDLIPDCSQLKI